MPKTSTGREPEYAKLNRICSKRNQLQKLLAMKTLQAKHPDEWKSIVDKSYEVYPAKRRGFGGIINDENRKALKEMGLSSNNGC